MPERQSGEYDLFRFGDFTVDIERREIRRVGERVTIEPKVFDLLVYLIRHRERAVGKDELLREIWGDVIVTESSLTRCILKARRAVCDDSRQQAVVRTVHSHGYRFVAELEHTSLRRPATADVEASKPSLAVLPFVNISRDADQAYFSEGVTEDIITELSRNRSLFVISRHSSFRYRDRSPTPQEIARDLGVSYIVDGSVQRSASRLRINVRLVDATQGTQLWAERYDRELEDVLLVQDEVARTVAATVGGRVEAVRGRERVDAAGLEAYDLVLRGQALYYRVDKAANAQARALLERAIATDPGSARAHALLAAVHSIDSWALWSADGAESLRLALHFGKRSLELDDTDSLAHALQAETLFEDGQRALAEAHFLRALELNPNDIAAHALYAAKLAAQGRVAEAQEQIEIAERLDPHGLIWIPWIKGTVMFTARRYDEAIAAYRRMDAPPTSALLELAGALALAGRLDEARTEVRRFLALARDEMPGFPGDSLADWEPLLPRLIDYQEGEDMAHFVHALALAWDGPRGPAAGPFPG